MQMFWGSTDAADATGPPPPTVTLYLERLKNATIAGDRRDIILELKEVAEANRSELGTTGLPILLNLLRVKPGEEPPDAEILEGVIRIFTDIVTPMRDDPDPLPDGHPVMVNTAALLKDHKSVELFLNLLQDSALWVRLTTIKLLTSLLYNQPDAMEAAVLSCSAGLMRLTDVLEDSREEIRYELLLLLLKLTESNAEVQNSIAFQEGFDKLFNIMHREGVEDGSIIVRDCLQIVANMLVGNPLTCKLFTQGAGMRHVTHILRVLPDASASAPTSPGGPPSWTPDKAACVKLCLDVVGAVAGAGAGPTSTFEAPEGLLAALVRLGTTFPHVAVPARVQAFGVLGGLLRGNAPNQGALQMLCVDVAAPTPGSGAGRRTPATPSPTPPAATPTPVLSLIFQHALFCGGANDVEAAAAFGVVEAYLEGNPGGQLALVGHVIAPPPAAALGLPDDAVPPAPPGQVVVHTLVRAAPSALLHTHDDQVITLFRACRLFTAMLRGDVTAKELGLRIAVGQGAAPVFDQVCVHTASALGDHGPQSALVKVSLARLLVEWLTGCPAAVAHFLSKPANLFVFDVAGGSPSSSARSSTPPLPPPPAAMGGPRSATPTTTASPLGAALPHCLAALVIAACLRYAPAGDGADQAGGGVAMNQATVLRMTTSRVTVSRFGRLLDDLGAAVAKPWPGGAAGPPPDVTPADYRLGFDAGWAAGIATLHDEVKGVIVELYTAPASDESDSLRREIVALQDDVRGARDARAAAVEELEALRDEHADLLVLLAEHDFTVMALKAALEAAGGAAAVAAATEEAQRQLDAFCAESAGGKGGGEEGEEVDTVDASSCSPGGS